jgi:hypothetical protein
MSLEKTYLISIHLANISYTDVILRRKCSIFQYLYVVHCVCTVNNGYIILKEFTCLQNMKFHRDDVCHELQPTLEIFYLITKIK